MFCVCVSVCVGWCVEGGGTGGRIKLYVDKNKFLLKYEHFDSLAPGFLNSYKEINGLVRDTECIVFSKGLRLRTLLRTADVCLIQLGKK